MTTRRTGTTLILGGTGKTGRRVAARLAARGLPVRIASRTGAPPFEWNDRSTWSGVLAGVQSIYLAYHPDLALPGAAATIRELARDAVAGGVKHIVLLSGRGEQGVLPSEQAVRECGATYTILRAAFFCQNFSEGMLAPPVLAGEVAFPAGNVAEPFIDIDDIADVAVAALVDDEHDNEIYELTGPRLLTFGQAVEEIAEATGRAIRYQPVSADAYAAALAPYVPAEHVTFLRDLFVEVLDGHNAHLADGVERALGRAPRDFRIFVRDALREGAFQQ